VEQEPHTCPSIWTRTDEDLFAVVARKQDVVSGILEDSTQVIIWGWCVDLGRL
jgi:hypothetical protein